MSVQHIAASLNSFSPSLAREEDLDDLPLIHIMPNTFTPSLTAENSYPHTCSASRPPL
jgi:hypothetical protein